MTRRTQSPTVFTLSTSSSAISTSKASSKASTTSTSRAEFTLRSSRMLVSIPTLASAAWFFAWGGRIFTTVSNTAFSVFSIPFLLIVPFLQNDTCVDVAETEARLDRDPQLGHLAHHVRDRRRVRGDLRMHVLAVDRRVHESAPQHQHGRHRLD